MGKFLYGAAVQGIQSFIFQTNKLREIVGASELVEQVCTTLFANLVFNGSEASFEVAGLSEQQTGLKEKLLHENNADCLMAAAGNIKYLFDKDTCQMVYLHFPRQVTLYAPGVTISQAVVELKGAKPTQEEINRLEDLLRARRNTPWPSLETGWAITDRSPRTGLPAIDNNGKGKERRDQGMVQKQLAAEKAKQVLMQKLSERDIPTSRIPFDMKDLAAGNDKQWIAVVHADGNSLGDIIRGLAKDKGEEAGNIFRKFSRCLDAATQKAAQLAFAENFESDGEDEDFIGIRPIVIGGDDITFLCRADKAIPFTKAFLRYFESQTEAQLKGLTSNLLRKKLSACAGIAFIKSSYPIHYGLSLAEDLCIKAKDASKAKVAGDPEAVVPASLAFHKVQDSFLMDWNEIALREMLYEQTGYPSLNFDGGPYAISEKDADGEHLNSLDGLLKKVEVLKMDNAPRSAVRQWFTELNVDFGAGDVRMERLLMVLKSTNKEIFIDSLGLNSIRKLKESQKDKLRSPLYQALMLTSLS